MPRAIKISTLAWVALFAHMTRFIAGAMTIGASVARHRVLNRSSARPPANLAMKSALAGAISTTCAQRASSTRPIAAQIGARRPTRHGLKAHGRDESLRRAGHDHLHVRAALHQSTHEVRTL